MARKRRADTSAGDPATKRTTRAAARQRGHDQILQPAQEDPEKIIRGRKRVKEASLVTKKDAITDGAQQEQEVNVRSGKSLKVREPDTNITQQSSTISLAQKAIAPAVTQSAWINGKYQGLARIRTEFDVPGNIPSTIDSPHLVSASRQFQSPSTTKSEHHPSHESHLRAHNSVVNVASFNKGSTNNIGGTSARGDQGPWWRSHPNFVPTGVMPTTSQRSTETPSPSATSPKTIFPQTVKDEPESESDDLLDPKYDLAEQHTTFETIEPVVLNSDNEDYVKEVTRYSSLEDEQLTRAVSGNTDADQSSSLGADAIWTAVNAKPSPLARSSQQPPPLQTTSSSDRPSIVTTATSSESQSPIFAPTAPMLDRESLTPELAITYKPNGEKVDATLKEEPGLKRELSNHSSLFGEN